VESAEVDTSHFDFGERGRGRYINDVGVVIALEGMDLVVGEVQGPVDGSKKYQTESSQHPSRWGRILGVGWT
jgi:hypothetical protein